MTEELKDARRVEARMTGAVATKKGMTNWATACPGSVAQFHGYSFPKIGPCRPTPGASIHNLTRSFGSGHRTGTTTSIVFVSFSMTRAREGATIDDDDALIIVDDALVWPTRLLGVLFAAAFAFVNVFRPDQRTHH